MGKHKPKHGVDAVERLPGTNEAVELLLTEGRAPTRSDAIRDAVCLVGLLFRRAKEASDDAKSHELRKQIAMARAEFGVR